MRRGVRRLAAVFLRCTLVQRCTSPAIVVARHRCTKVQRGKAAASRRTPRRGRRVSKLQHTATIDRRTANAASLTDHCPLLMRPTLISFIDDCASRGQETAVVHQRGLRLHRWSYGRLASTAHQVARELEQRNIAKGERVLLFGENSPEWIAAFFGCLIRGAIAVPLDKLSAPDFITRVQGRVNARLLLADADLVSQARLTIPTIELDGLGDAVAHHSPSPFNGGGHHGDDLIEIIFTSGTTAEPRGVCITHRNFLANIGPLERKIAEYRRWEKPFHPVRFMSLLPLGHVFGQFMGIFVPQLLGGEVHFQESLKPSAIIETVRKKRITVIAAFPRLLETLKEKLERDIALEGKTEVFRRTFEAAGEQRFLRRAFTFRGIHRRFGWKFWAFVSGGATLDRDTEEFWRRLGYAVVHGYGMTETASIISLPNPFSPVSGSIGRVLADQEVKLDPSGEILVRGENIAAGYWAGPEGVKPITGDEGWLRTGDIGEFDREGNLFFRGREKNIIATASGMKIYPEDLEAALDRQSEVRASCVIGIECAQGPEALAVLIIDSASANPGEIVRRANETLATHQQIRRWVVWTESDFPRTNSTGKIIKRLVAEALKQGEGGLLRTSDDGVRPPSSIVLQEVARITGDAGLQPTSSSSLSSDLKLDSLGRVELLSALEDRYQIELDEAAFTSAATLGDVERMIRDGATDAVPYPYPDWPHSFPVRWTRSVVYYLLLLPLTRLLCWVRVIGGEHLRNESRPIIFISNHVTMVDPALILSALPAGRRRRLAIAMIGEFLREWRHPPAGTPWFNRVVLRFRYTLVVALFNVFPLPQQSGFRRSFAYAGEMIDRGDSLLIFPEGQRTKHGGLNPFMLGTGKLIRTLSVPVIPIKIEGLFELGKQGKRWVRPGRVIVKFGKPMEFSREETPAGITQTLEEAVAAL